jgi:hypothetical protein
VTASRRRQEGPRLQGALLHLTLALVVSLAGTAGAADESAAAPAKGPRFANTFDSPEALAREFLSLLAAGDPEQAVPLAISEREYKDVVWPEMPAAPNVPVNFAWDNMWPKSRYGLDHTFRRHGGQSLTLVRVVFAGETTEYKTFTVHRDARCVVRDADGKEQTLDLFGSVLEDGGRYKLFSFVVD